MIRLDSDCIFSLYPPVNSALNDFDCGNSDLNDFFTNEASLYTSNLLGKTYCFFLESAPSEIVCIFTVANDSIKSNRLPKNSRNKIGRKIPWVKQSKNYPGVLIGRLGVNTKYHNSGIGSQTLDFVKAWFVSDDNKTGCRFVIVDAYNEDSAIKFYQKNGFNRLN